MNDLPPPPGREYPPPPPLGEQALPPRTLGEILSAAFDIYRQNAAQLLEIVAVVVIPLSVISYLVSRVALGVKTRTEILGGQTVKVAEPRSFWIFVLGALIAAAIAIITTAILEAAILRGASQATIGDPVDIRASYRWGLQRFGSVLLVSILVGLAVAVGFLFLVIPGIILLVLFAVSVPAVVVENARGIDAMKRSWNLTIRHFWHVLAVILVAAIIAAVIGGVITALAGSSRVLGVIFGAIGQIIVAPFSALVTVLLYLDLRSRTENLTPSTLRAELQSGA
jgi:hypothetical protein